MTETLAIFVVSILAILGAVWAFRTLAAAVDFRLRGYRVRQVERHDYTVWRPGLTDWLYEEKASARTTRALRIHCERLTGERARRVYIPNPDTWESRTPEWAQGRRDEIVKRIVECFGRHTVIEDVDRLDGRICSDSLQTKESRFPSWWILLPEQLLLAVPFAVVAIGPWASIQLLNGRWWIGGTVLTAWLVMIGALGFGGVRRGYVSAGVAVTAVLAAIGVAVCVVGVYSSL
jgi:hypothetical protein